MIPQTFLAPQFTTLIHSPSPLLVISLGIIPTAALFTYLHALRQRRYNRQLHPDPEFASTASSPPADAKQLPQPPPLLPHGASYTDLPPPLRTTLHSPLAGDPWTSADLASHPWSRYTYTLPSHLPPVHQQQQQHQQQHLHQNQPPSNLHVTETLQYFPLSPPSTLQLPLQSQSPSTKGWRRRRTLVFENVATSSTDDGGPHEPVMVKMEGQGQGEERQQQQRVEHEAPRPVPATVIAEVDVWARLRSGEVDI